MELNLAQNFGVRGEGRLSILGATNSCLHLIVKILAVPVPCDILNKTGAHIPG